MSLMDVRIRTTDLDLTPAINDYTEERLMAIRHLLGASEGSERCEVELGRTTGHAKHGEVWFAEINLYVSDGGHFFARTTGESVNAAIDMVKDEILAQLRKHKQQERGMLRRSGALLKRLLHRE